MLGEVVAWLGAVAIVALVVSPLGFGLWLSHRAGRRVGAWASEQWGGSDG